MSSSVKRVYQDWKGNNHFFLGGRLIFGPDVRSLFATIALILFPVVIFCVFVARDLLHKFPDYNAGYAILVVAIAYTIFVLVLLFLTSAQDPGIVPRALNPPEEDLVECAGQTPRLRIARVKEIPYNGMTVKVKYCDTCMLYRPPRCSHCSICNNCVERFDHHCPWVGQCIGMRNYRYFFMFVSSSTFLCIFIFSMCALDVKFKTHEYQTVARALRHSAASIVLMAYSFICVWFVGGLTVFHLYLISQNQTTYENFKYRAENRINLYDLGCLSNFRGIFCTSAPTSRINLRSPAQQGPNQPTPVPLPSNDTDDQDAYVRSKVEDDLEIGRALSKVSERSFEGGDIRDRGSTHHDSGPGSFPVAFEQGIGVHPPSQGGTRRHSSWGGRGDNWEISHDMLGMNSAAAQGAKSASDVSGGQNR